MATAPHIWRELDATFINKVLNHPAVRPTVDSVGEGAIDVSAQVAREDNYLLVGQWGGCMFFHVMPGVYEIHTQCLPEGRGAWMAAFVNEAFRWVFTRTPCWEVVTRVPVGHAAARVLTLKSGFTKEFTRHNECKFRGEPAPLDVYRLCIHDWVDASKWAEEAGEAFHDQLQAEAARLNITAPAHENDPQHNRIAGAAVEMARRGQVVKAVLFYDRWAFIARHAPVQFISQDPPVIKMDLGLLRILPDGIKVSL